MSAENRSDGRVSFDSRVVRCAAISGVLAVLMGSFGAHGLESVLSDRGYESELVVKRLDQYDVGVRYHLVHTVALLALAALPVCNRKSVAILMTLGIVLFSGSLYLLVLTNTPWLGAITPLGGLSWIFGWSWLALRAR